jgi:predicted transporter
MIKLTGAPKCLLRVTKTVMYLVKIQHCFCDLGSHFEALKSVLLIFFLVYASKKYDQTDSCAPKCLPRVTKTVMYLVKIQHCFCDLGSHFEALESVLLIFFLVYASKKYDQTDSCAPKCLPQVTKTVMYLVKIQQCFCDLGSHFEALESVLLIFFLVYASKKYDQTDSCAPKCLPQVTKTVMYLVKIQHCFCDLGSHFEALESVLLIFFLVYASKKYDQTDSCAPKCLHQITKTVMYIVLNTTLFM